MDQSYRSLIVPAVLSALSLTATLVLFGKWEREASLDSPDAKPIAFLTANTEKIERRSKKRIIWQTLDEGGSIYSGDAVRTPPKAEGNVQLVKGDTIVTLEPDSLIILDETNGRLELNLVSGSLLVDSKGTGKNSAAGPVIRSGNTRLEIGKSGTQLSLSKTKGAEANVAVAKGEVEINAGDKKVVVQEGRIGTLSSGGVTTMVGLESLSPKPNETIIINQLPDRRGAFTWKPLAGGGRVHLELGAFRGEVKDVGVSAPVGAGSVTAPVPTGTFYWRLVRRDPAGKLGATSMVLRAEGVFQSPPSLYAPAAGEIVLLKPKTPGIEFSWSRPPKVRALTLQISGDKTFATGSSLKLGDDEKERTVNLTKEGVYYWRLTGTWEGQATPLASEVRRLELRKAQDLPAPVATRPAAGASFSEQAVKTTGVLLEWSKVPGAAKYRLQVSAKGTSKFDESVNATARFVNGLSPGTYEWRVMAEGGDGINSPWSEVRSLVVARAAVLKWVTAEGGEHEYAGPKPTIDLAWEKGSPDAVSWRIRSAPSKSELASAPWTKAGKTTATMSHDAPGGRYYEVQALAEGDVVVAVSSPLRAELRPMPDLEPPVLLTSGNADLTAKSDGSLTLKWKQVAGAGSYGISLRREGGKAVELKSPSNSYVLNDLLPGKYELKLRSHGSAKDPGRKPGKFGETRLVNVPSLSNVPPPVWSDVKVH